MILRALRGWTPEGDTLYACCCLCGAVRFEVSDVNPGVHVCYCTMCTIINNGGPAMASFTSQGVHLSASEALRFHDTSAGGRRAFCGLCGTSLYWQSRSRPEIAYVSTGAFATPPPFHIAERAFLHEAPAHFATAPGGRVD